MAQKPRTKGIPKVTNYSGLVTFATTCIAAITGNLLFPTPVPTLISIGTLASTVSIDIANWGPVGARGPHTALMQLRADALSLRNLLVQLEGYVLNQASLISGDYAAQSAAIVSTGFGVKNPPVPQGLLGRVQNLHQFFKDSISIYHVALKFKKPLGLTSPGNVKNFQIYRGSVDNINDAGTVCIGTSTKTLFIDNSPLQTAGASYYWVTASNDAGIGAPTASLIVNVVTP